jgi:hypothetical protein
MNTFVLRYNELPSNDESYSYCMIANYNGDYLYAVDGDAQLFLQLNPTAREYYEADWEQNAFPNSPGDTPLEKYLNAINGVTMDNPPKWNNILPALASSSFFAKILTTQNPNAFSALQTVVQYRNMDLFMVLAKATLEAIPGGLTEAEFQELNTILIQNNFPLIK